MKRNKSYPSKVKNYIAAAVAIARTTDNYVFCELHAFHPLFMVEVVMVVLLVGVIFFLHPLTVCNHPWLPWSANSLREYPCHFHVVIESHLPDEVLLVQSYNMC